MKMASPNRISCIIGTAGHVDHGKTTLVKALTGIDTDRLIEEKTRGLTTDIGFAYIDMEGTAPNSSIRAALIDVPGHERFIKNMLAGVSGIDLVLFVVAADDGVMPQTREHLDIIHLLGIRDGIFVITKCDLADGDRVGAVRGAVEALARDTILRGSPVVEVSGVTGEGIERLKALIREYVLKSRRHEAGGFFRLPVDRSFTVKGFGTVVTGTVASGTARQGDDLRVFPTGAKVKIRGIQSLYLQAECVSRGQRAALNLSGVSYDEIGRGLMLVSPELFASVEGALSKARSYYDCSFELLGKGGEAQTAPRTRTKKSVPVKVHHFTDEALGVARFPEGAAEGSKTSGRLMLKKPLLMLRGDRFILLDTGANSVIGGGTLRVPYLSKGVAPGRNRVVAAAPDVSDVNSILMGLLLENGGALDKRAASLMLNIRMDELPDAIDGGGFGLIGDYIADIKTADSIKGRIIGVVREFHGTNPSEPGIREEELIKRVLPQERASVKQRPAGFLSALIDQLVAGKTLKREGRTIALSSYRPALSGADSLVEAAIRALFTAPFAQPSIDDIKKLPFAKGDIDRVFNYLLRSAEIVRLKEGSFISKGVLDAARERLAVHMGEKGSIRASEFRDLLGCGRKLAIEILEHFDGERLTLRQGDLRVLRR
ncbi:MAG: selenocysteine-specific translation elongation factor [Deltaproteobacteria bacterium]|nr:selenocysteine-specific translation elongation factor [Deltaproteobacteria bacterium]